MFCDVKVSTMANYYCTTRTNYFRVTNEERYQQLFKNLTSEDNISDWKEDIDGVTYHAFGTYGSIDYDTTEDETYHGEEEFDLDYFFDEMGKILPDDEAMIVFQSGHEKLRYVTGFAIVATSKGHTMIDIENAAILAARDMLGNPEFTTKCDY